MTEHYNPVVRTFNQLRSSLIYVTGRKRHDIRPNTPLGELLPEKIRRAAWKELRAEWRELEPLGVSWLAEIVPILLLIVTIVFDVSLCHYAGVEVDVAGCVGFLGLGILGALVNIAMLVWLQRRTLLPIIVAASLAIVMAMAALSMLLKEFTVLFAIVPIDLLFYLVIRRRAVEFPIKYQTVGELVMQLIEFDDHRDSGHRWTRNEVAFKVRSVLSEALNVDFNQVTPDKTLAELGAE